MGHQGGFKLKTCILFWHWCRTIKKKNPALCNKLGKRKAFAKCCHCKKKKKKCISMWGFMANKMFILSDPFRKPGERREDKVQGETLRRPRWTSPHRGWTPEVSQIHAGSSRGDPTPKTLCFQRIASFVNSDLNDILFCLHFNWRMDILGKCSSCSPRAKSSMWPMIKKLQQQLPPQTKWHSTWYRINKVCL